MTTVPATSFIDLAQGILAAVGGTPNVDRHVHCMTRLRVTVVRPDPVDYAALRQLPGVLGVVEGNPLQVVIGPGAVKQVASAFVTALAQEATAVPPAALTPAASASAAIESNAPPAKRGNAAVRRFLRRIAAICTPLIPALIGAGLVKALAGVLLLWSAHAGAGLAPALATAASVASLIGSAFFAFLLIQVGMNAAREFDGTASLGGATASVMLLPSVATLQGISLPWLGAVALQPGQGGLMGALAAGALVAWIERQLRTRIPPAIETLVTPTVALLAAGTATLFVLMPVAGVLTDEIGRLTQVLLKEGGMPAAFLLAASFIGLLMFGLHQALIPIHAQLIAQYGYTALFPILAMSGCGQAGSAIAIYFRTRDPVLKRRILDTLPTCMLGIGEPLLYSVTLPLGRPLVTCSIGGGVGAMVLGYFASHGDYVGATTIGPANLLLIPLVTGPLGVGGSIAVYCLAALTAYASAFVLTWFFGLPNEHRHPQSLNTSTAKTAP
ncbi:PTS transporter subunit EIIC [Pseudoduganella lutea]|uniref:PTS system N-acetylmuramic acid-specific EIIBC component n=1 Tax=Pseudoduganella lutea TaxID=321985 RepID=A0A4P6KUI3_9BURK|nr:PTS transporter subunit EIIC [Pseudoduganella lutea]QBE62741.1 PTS sugar transporter subunit IIC [Pseudoduganella lutea]